MVFHNVVYGFGPQIINVDGFLGGMRDVMQAISRKFHVEPPEAIW